MFGRPTLSQHFSAAFLGGGRRSNPIMTCRTEGVNIKSVGNVLASPRGCSERAYNDMRLEKSHMYGLNVPCHSYKKVNNAFHGTPVTATKVRRKRRTDHFSITLLNITVLLKL